MASTKTLAIVLIVVAVIAFIIGYYTYPLLTPTPSKQTTTTTPAKTSKWEEIKKRGYIVVATSPDWPPFEYIDPNTKKLVGYEVDLMNAIAKKLGLQVKWKQLSFDSIIAAVKNGEVDLGVSGFSITPERCEQVLFTIYHDVTEAQLIMLADKAEKLGIKKLDKLADAAKYGIVIGTGSGTTEEQELLDLVKKGILKPSQVKSYQDFGAALKDLEAGNIDAVYAETPVTTWWISTEPVKLTVIYAKPYWPVAFIANKDSQELVSKINGIIAQMIASGELDQIKAKWNITTPP